MHLKSAMILMLFNFLFQMTFDISIVAAQTKPKSSIIVKSEPPGAMVYFQGENSFVGITPFKLHPAIRGTYKMSVSKRGFEKGKYEYFFSGREKGTLKLKLSPKTRVKAGLRSVVFPGWGQSYAERKMTGILMSLLQVGTVIGTITSVRDYDNAVDEYENALKIYEKNKKQSSDTYWEIVVKKHKQADDTFNRKQMWLWISGGLWIYNILDSMIFFPSFEKEMFNRSVPTLSANFQGGTASLMFTMSF